MKAITRAIRRRQARRAERGFTLIEIMVVVVIIGLLATLVGPEIWSLLFQSQKDIAYTKCKSYYDLIKTRQSLSRGQMINDLSELETPLNEGDDKFTEVVPDPWGEDYFMETDGRRFWVISPGPDRAQGTDDDISYPKRGEEG